MPDAGVELYGRKGARICSLNELADFKRLHDRPPLGGFHPL